MMNSLQRIQRDITDLTSDAYAGRLSGTEGARKAARFLAKSLQVGGYAPMGDNGYYSSVNVSAARLAGPAHLVIGGDQCKHRYEFAEWLPYSSGGQAVGELATVRADEEVDSAFLAGKIVLIPERPDGFDIKGTIASAAEIGIQALLVESGEPHWFPKTVFGSARNEIPLLRLRRSLVERYADNSGIQVELDLPIETKSLPCNNVLGFLQGGNASGTLLLSAHYDHLGDDPGGLRFPGAIDNASGVAVMLEIARQFASEADRLPFNILAAFLTGEESGLWGARQLIANPPVPITAAINLDCLGFEPELYALRTGHGAPGHWLANLAAGVIQKHGIDVKWIAGGDDSAAYLEKGIAAIGLGQKPTLPSSVSIHSTQDDAEHIHAMPLQQGLLVISDIIAELKLQIRRNLP